MYLAIYRAKNLWEGMIEKRFVALTLIKGIGNKTLKKLLEFFESPEDILETDNKNFEKYKNFIRKSLTKEIEDKAEEIIQRCYEKNIKILHIKHPHYPEILKEIPDPPIVIYAKGNIPINEKSISVVGSRKFSSYGKVVTEKFVSELSEFNINIISGLAIGIDTIAHKTALRNSTFTTAVLGSGIDIVFPRENKKLYLEIIEKGCILSEYPPGTNPTKYTFPQRNRIIAGLSYGTIVTEASNTSGALITSKLANDYGRTVFSVPANINNPFAEGNNILIKEGAVPLTDLDDLKENLPFLFDREKEEKVKNLALTEDEILILNLIVEPKHIDSIVEKTGLSFDRVSEILFNLEMNDLLENKDGFYIKK